MGQWVLCGAARAGVLISLRTNMHKCTAWRASDNKDMAGSESWLAFSLEQAWLGFESQARIEFDLIRLPLA